MKQLARRSLGIFVAGMMLLTTLPRAFALESDIRGHWAEEALQSFADNGYLAGDGRGHYMPNAMMTRAQFATVMNRLVGLTEESAAIANYTDVSTSDWYYRELAKALAAGFVSGTSATTMSPDAPISRQQAFTMLSRYLKLNTSDTSALNAFADQDTIADYARGPMAAMVDAGYVQGSDDRRLLPEKQLTRAEGVTVLYRAKSSLQAGSRSSANGLKDGVYTGTGAGYGGTVKVQMTVSGGNITELEILSHSDTGGYMNRAKKLLDTVVKKQSADGVDTISGATLSSKGLLTAVNACISQAQGGKDTSKTGATGGGGHGGINTDRPAGTEISKVTTGTYIGSARGYSGTTTVQVAVDSNGKITKIDVMSHGDTSSYFNRAKRIVDSVISKQSTKVDAVSGATYSSYGILSAIENALKGATGSQDHAQTYSVVSWKEFTQALAQAKDGDTIRLAKDITDAGQVDAVSAATATINKAVTIDGNGKSISAYKGGKVTKNTTDKSGAIISISEVEATFCFNVTTATGIQLKNLTIDGASFGTKLGGAMYVETGAGVTLSGVTFKNCAAGNTSAGNGGAAIYAEPHKGASPTITAVNCKFENNAVNRGATGRGGAIYGYNANVTLQGCTFSGNKAAYGGAVAAAGTTKLTVTGCTFASSNDGVYGGDDIYIFDGYTFYKKTMATDSAVSSNFSGNTHSADGNDFAGYRVICGRVLGEISDTTSSSGNTITKTCAGSGALFLGGHDVTFANTDYDRMGKTAPAEKTAEYKYVLMNIPYDAFYAAELSGNQVKVDAVSSATKNKTRNGGMMSGGSYHVNADGTDITGITFPVMMAKEVDLSNYKKVTDSDSVSITVISRGQSSAVSYTGKDALFESPSYSYYELSEIPAFYKVMTVGVDGTLSFGKIQGMATDLIPEAVGTLSTNSRYGDYQLNLMNTGLDEKKPVIYGVVLRTKEGADYGLRHLENIWRYTQLAFCTGFKTEVHGCVTSADHYKSIMGKTITGVTYFTDQGQFDLTLSESLYVPVKFANTFEVAGAVANSGTTTVTMSGFPDDFTAEYTVATAAGDLLEGFSCDGSTLTWSGIAPKPGNYTLTAADRNKVYASVATSFTLASDSAVAEYDSQTQKLKVASDVSEEALSNYLRNITSVSVDGTAYGARGRGAVPIIDGKTGLIDVSAKPFQIKPQSTDSGYAVTVTATGYPELSFSMTIPDKIYAAASLTGGKLILTLKDAHDGAVELSKLENPKLTLSSGAGKNTVKLLENLGLTDLNVEIPDAVVGTEYTGIITSDNHPAIVFQATAEVADTMRTEATS